MGWKKYDTSTLEENDRRRIESMKKYIKSLNLNKPFLYKDLPEAYNPVDPDHPEWGNVQARAGIDQGKPDKRLYNSNVVVHTDGTQSRVWSSSVYPPRGGQHQSPKVIEAPLRPAQPPSTLDRMLRVGKAIGVIR